MKYLENINIYIFNYLHGLAFHYTWFDKLVVFLSNDFGYLLIVVCFIYLLFRHIDQSNKHTINTFGRTSIYNYAKKLLVQWHPPHPILRRRVKEIIFIFSGAGLSWALVTVLKDLFVNPRPFILYPSIETLFRFGSLESFPSGHSAFYAALAVSIFAYHRRAGIWFALGAVVIGVSRIIAGVHFPLDVLFGFIFGASVAILVYVFFRKLAKMYKKQVDFVFEKL
ncbi:MAG: phosphatase PAP2 family protein [Minisyncoccia bacterium]